MKNVESKELGFGTKTSGQKARLINKDGSFNVDRVEQSRWQSISMFHALTTMPWGKFNLVVFLYFIGINLIFATIYYFTGIDGLQGVQAHSEFDKFLEAFFFSTQTFSTVGFGRISPAGHVTSSIAAIESLVGLLGFALATGLLYGRFSRPVVKLLFSENAIIAPFREGKAFQFRLANRMRNSQITDLTCRVTVAKLQNENGNMVRRFLPLELEIKNIIFFPMTWTVNHPIDENSPLWEMTEKDMHEADLEFMISLSGFDDTFSQNVSARYSYTHEELIYGAKWISVFGQNANKQTVQDLNKLSLFERYDFPAEVKLKKVAEL
ncbi:MAG: ion channel [Bacteroidia bacterium]